jgi:aldehyde:ferredoxin oxidoreductase
VPTVGRRGGIYNYGGRLSFGDSEAAIRVLQSVDKGDEMGTAIGNGLAFTGKKYAVARVPAIKGQAIPAWEPRTLKGTGVTYCTSPMGPDHTAGLVTMPPVDAVAASKDAQLVAAICDSSGFCHFVQPSLDEIRQLFNLMYGLNMSGPDIVAYGWQCLEDEWEFNRRAGFTEQDDQIPEFMTTEPVPTSGNVFDVSKEDLRRIYDPIQFREELLLFRAGS